MGDQPIGKPLFALESTVQKGADKRMLSAGFKPCIPLSKRPRPLAHFDLQNKDETGVSSGSLERMKPEDNG